MYDDFITGGVDFAPARFSANRHRVVVDNSIQIFSRA